MAKILLIDDDTTYCLMLKTWLEKRGFEIKNAFSCKDALRYLTNENFDIILCDLRLPDGSGIDILKDTKSKRPDVQFVMMTSYADIETAVMAMKLGAKDYVAKPIIPDEILKKINDLLSKGKSRNEKVVNAKSQYVMGTSSEALQLYEYIKLVAPTMMTVLITGESGSGKEYIARLVHALSDRKNAPFMAVDCGVIPKELAASEFFGHVKGAFTGALSDKVGIFAEADGGTVFLDEIGNLDYDIQVQLLRALEERKIKPVGSNKERSFNVRIISATNENLSKEVVDGTFREDLFHRLNEFSLKALSLRNRGDDLMLFANHFLLMANEDLNKNVVGFDEEVQHIFRNYAWPGNLRELRNVVKRATLLCTGNFISIKEIPSEMILPEGELPKNFTLRHSEDEITRIKEALVRCNYNKSEAAKLLKIDRKTLYNKLKLYDIN